MKKQGAAYFSDTYVSARTTFIRAARQDGISHFTYRHPQRFDETGTALSTDVAWYGPRDAKAVLLVTSGLHGVEGYAGSAIQTAALQEKIFDKLPAGMAIVYVHGLNAHGFAKGRRVDENNVDCNRNAIDWDKGPPADHPLTPRIQPLLLPRYWNRWWVMACALYYIGRHGLKNMQAALQQGQYSHPQGLYYGGDKQAATTKILSDIIRRCTDKAVHIAHVDIHTGLGPRGHGEIIMTPPDSDPATQRAVQWWGRDSVRSTTAGNSVSADVQGSIEYLFNDAARKGCEVTVATLEFGTRPLLEVFEALAFDNWVYAKNKGESWKEDARKQMRYAFAPRDADWEDKVVRRGLDVLRQAKDGLEKTLKKTPKITPT